MALDIMAELMGEEEETSTGHPKPWYPENEPVLVGVVEGYTVAPGRHGPCRTCILRREKDGSRVAVWFNAVVLETLFKQEDPKIGDRIGLRFLGVHPEKRYKRFKMVVDRNTSPSPAPPVARLTPPAVQVDSCTPDPFGDDETPFGTNPYPESYAVAMTRPPARSNGRPLTITPPRAARR